MIEEDEIKLLEHLSANSKYLGTQTKVFLDLNFWIEIYQEDALLTKFELLSDVIFPINESVLREISKINNPKRENLIRAMFRLSRGYTMVDLPSVIRQEFQYAFDQILQKKRYEQNDQCLWVRFSEVSTITKRVEQYAKSGHINSYYKAAENIKFPTQNNAYRARSFKGLYKDELIGALDFFSQLSVRALLFTNREVGLPNPAPNTNEFEKLRRAAVNVLVLPQSDVQFTPSIKLMAAFHALIRLDRHRVFKANDLLDIEHVSVAASYYDQVYSDSGIITLLSQKPMKRFYKPDIILGKSMSSLLENSFMSKD